MSYILSYKYREATWVIEETERSFSLEQSVTGHVDNSSYMEQLNTLDPKRQLKGYTAKTKVCYCGLEKNNHFVTYHRKREKERKVSHERNIQKIFSSVCSSTES